MTQLLAKKKNEKHQTQPSTGAPIDEMAIGLPKGDRASVTNLLQPVLADQHVLYIKTRNFHWNLRGARFHTLHEFYETQYQRIAKSIDATAERIRMIGGVAAGSMTQFVGVAGLSEEEGRLIEGDESIELLVTDHETFVRHLRPVISAIEDRYGDVGTADYLTGLLREHEEMAWMLRSFLQ